LIAVGLTVCTLLLLGTPALFAADNDAEKIDKLIQKMGSKDFDEREAASKELEKIGEPALRALKNAVKENQSEEIRRRAKVLVETLEAAAKLDHLIQQFCEGKVNEQKAAAKELRVMGQPAIDALRKVADDHKDEGVRGRAKTLAARIDPRGITIEHINGLIKQLAADEYDKRQAATKELMEIGEPALDNLRKAAKKANDLEVRVRLEAIIKELAGR
jgi:hypothetical protein